ncbi:hypothetical protein UYO_1560 [Lachnospiraceae bacterium JC7]|nr:hypothetical protein UYO_1560 [Lachnospiraceae bacterium JC7]
MDKKLRDLDDVNKALKEPPVEEVMERRRVGRRQTAMRKTGNLNFDELRGLLTIPVIIIILMIIIVVLDKEPEEMIETAAPVTETVVVETQAPLETETEKETEDPTIVREYYDEYLTSFFQQYFDARLQADVDKLYTLTGVTNQTEEQKTLLQTQLQTQAGYIEAYNNIKQFAVNALEENSKLVFVTYDVKFRRVDTAAPGIMYCYVKVNDANQFEIIENLTSEQTKFVNEYVTDHEEVRELINSNNSKLLQAISSDERLAVIYDAFQSGRIYTDSQENIDSQVSLIKVDGNDVTVAETTSENTEESAVPN